MVSIRRLLQLRSSPTLPLGRFSQDLFVILQEIIYQPFFSLIYQIIAKQFFLKLIADRF